MAISKTLVIKHLPGVLDEREKEDFLKYFGAREIRFLRSQYNKYNVAFARFENERTAENVLHRLHQTTFLGHCLSVEFANDTSISSSPGEQNLPVPDNKETNDRYYDQFLDKLSCWHSGFNFKLPVPNHLKYQYPPPNAPILINILKVLVAVPKFYTQVLHLMNKMNLPCPLSREVLAEVDLKFDSLSWADTLLNSKPGEKAVTTPPKPSSESEISTDEELTPETTERTPKKQDFIIKTKRWLSKMKRPLPATGCAKAHKTKFEDVFEKPTSERETKKIKLNYSGSVFHGFDEHSVPGQANDQPELNNSGFGFLNPITKPGPPDKEVVRDEREEERWSQDEIICIKESELTNNRIPEKDRSVLPVFQNYTEGVPTCRLYIKNLAKTVMETDLRYIYHRYLPNSSELDGEPSMFDIRLMQEGRMKGQAFVTLQTVELAQKALKETNGYILKNKPLVVQFARSAPK